MSSVVLLEDFLDQEEEAEGGSNAVTTFILASTGASSEQKTYQTGRYTQTETDKSGVGPFFEYKDTHGEKRLQISEDGRVERPYMSNSEYRFPDRFLSTYSAFKKTACFNKTWFGDSNSSSCSRSCVLLIDFSDSMKEMDFKPSRLQCVQSVCLEFVSEFLSLNPISEMSVFLLKDREAIMLSAPSGSLAQLRDALERGMIEQIPAGDPSLYCGLDRALHVHREVTRSYRTKEIIIIYGSCYTRDEGNLETLIGKLKENKIVANVVSLAPELRILKLIASETGGDDIICSTRAVIRDAILMMAKPKFRAVSQETMKSELILMGFPDLNVMSTASLCVCHNQLRFDGYICPRCLCRSCSIPSTCKACDLPLSSSIEIARCQTMNIVNVPFIPTPTTPPAEVRQRPQMCCCCGRPSVSGGSQCPICGSDFCFDCDNLVHSTLQVCPGCSERQLLKRQGIKVNPKRSEIPPLPREVHHADFLNKLLAMFLATRDDNDS